MLESVRCADKLTNSKFSTLLDLINNTSNIILLQVVIKSLVGKQSLNLKSRHGSEITEVKIVGNDRYVLGHTTDTLILADMIRKTSCEVGSSDWLIGKGRHKLAT